MLQTIMITRQRRKLAFWKKAKEFIVKRMRGNPLTQIMSKAFRKQLHQPKKKEKMIRFDEQLLKQYWKKLKQNIIKSSKSSKCRKITSSGNNFNWFFLRNVQLMWTNVIIFTRDDLRIIFIYWFLYWNLQMDLFYQNIINT